MKKCDIIIPVYNAFECLPSCFESVLKCTDFSYTHLIIINDKSSDSRVLPLLKKYKNKYPDKITLLENNNNIGFVGTVNKGMKYSKNDVLLLNSDTEVTEGWLKKICLCAYSDASIATVTPLSNNATLASVPKIFEKNSLPEGYDLDRMAKTVEKSSLNIFPSIPTAHGFCMFIKREAIDKVGLFDEKNFGKGYGEENDFCFRCFRYGYRHVLCDNTFILHKESKSFLETKKDNGAILAKKHPKLKSNLDFWCAHPDIKYIGQNLALGIGCYEKRPNILIIIHDWSNINENVGGTTLHVLDIINNLRTNYNFHVLSHEDGTYRIHSYFKSVDLITAIYPEPINIFATNFYSSVYEKMLEEIINDYGISLVHIHHMIGHYFNIKDVCKKNRIRYLVSLHDLYLAFPEISRLDEKVSLKTAANSNKDINLESWRNVCKDLLSSAATVITPSTFAQNIYQQIYPKQPISVIEHGITTKKTTLTISNKSKNIAFVGAIFPHKGSNILEGIINSSKLKGYRFHLFGTTTAKISSSKKILNHGKYSRQDLAKLLSKHHISLVCIFSLAPETFAYTVDEVAAAGVPILSFNIGAGAERINVNNLGWTINYTTSIDTIASFINKILNDSSSYNSIVKSIQNYQVRSVSAMALDYDKIYKKDVVAKTINNKKIQSRLPLIDLCISSLSHNNDVYRNAYESITSSFRWRVISKIRIPAKISTTLRKAYKKIKK